MGTGFAQRQKTEIIGKFSWYTEQNAFEDVVQVAQKADKPILAVFSATWCGPCQQLKTSLLKTDEFKKIADEVVLLYIEQTTKEGAAYNSKYKVIGFPSFRIFSQQGILLDKGFPDRTVAGFLKWISDVKAGNNFYELSRKLEQNPNDLETLVKIAGKLDGGERDMIFDYLLRAIKINPDFNDQLAQEAYEKLAYFLLGGLPFKEGKEKEEYVARWQKTFQAIVDAYYPNKFKYELKGNIGLNYILNWFYRSRQFEKVLFYFNDFLKRKGDGLDFTNDIIVFADAIPGFVSLGKLDEAERWIVRIRDFAKRNENVASEQRFIRFYFELFNGINGIIRYFELQGQGANAEKYAGILAEDMVRMKQGMLAVVSVTSQATTLVNMGKKAEARKVLIALYKNEAFFNSLDKQVVPGALQQIAWTMAWMEIANQTSLEIAKKSVTIDPAPANKDTLACVHAALGNFEEAVKIETEALAEEKDESVRQDYMERIRTWQAKIK
jgi:thiol-disulfide isomerase/thioredoxin